MREEIWYWKLSYRVCSVDVKEIVGHLIKEQWL